MKILLLALMLWILKVWIEHRPKREVPGAPKNAISAEEWYKYGI